MTWDDRGVLGGEIGVQQLHLFKCLISEDMKVTIFMSTTLKILKYIKKKPIFDPKMPYNAFDYECKR